jgi:hypothetical protein
MRHRRLFTWVFLLTSAVQLIFYFLFWVLGTDTNSGLSDFGNLYLRIYSPAVDGTLAVLHGIGEVRSLGDIAFAYRFAPLLGVLAYSAILAVVVLGIRTAFSGRHNENTVT